MMKNQAIMVPKICFFSITIIVLACLAGCTQAEQAQSIKAVTASQELLLPAPWTPTVAPSKTMASTPTETPTPEPTATLTPTPMGMLSRLTIDDAGEIAWSPDGERIALLSRNRLNMYQASDLSQISSTEIAWEASNLNFSPDGMYLAACDSRYVKLDQLDEGHFAVWDGITGELILDELFTPPCPAQLITTGALIFYIDEGGGFNEPMKFIHQWQIGIGFVEDLKFAHVMPHGNKLIGITSDGTYAVFHATQSQPYLGELEFFYWITREGGGTSRVKIPATRGWRAFLASNDRQLGVQDDRRCSYTLSNIQSGIAEGSVDWCDLRPYKDLGVESVDLSQDGRYLAVVFQGGRLTIWNVATGQMIHEVKSDSPPVYGFAFHPDGIQYAILTNEWDVNSLSIWELSNE
jgi:WD40 repeat protein